MQSARPSSIQFAWQLFLKNHYQGNFGYQPEIVGGGRKPTPNWRTQARERWIEELRAIKTGNVREWPDNEQHRQQLRGELQWTREDMWKEYDRTCGSTPVPGLSQLPKRAWEQWHTTHKGPMTKGGRKTPQIPSSNASPARSHHISFKLAWIRPFYTKQENDIFSSTTKRAAYDKSLEKMRSFYSAVVKYSETLQRNLSDPSTTDDQARVQYQQFEEDIDQIAYKLHQEWMDEINRIDWELEESEEEEEESDEESNTESTEDNLFSRPPRRPSTAETNKSARTTTSQPDPPPRTGKVRSAWRSVQSTTSKQPTITQTRKAPATAANPNHKAKDARTASVSNFDIKDNTADEFVRQKTYQPASFPHPGPPPLEPDKRNASFVLESVQEDASDQDSSTPTNANVTEELNPTIAEVPIFVQPTRLRRQYPPQFIEPNDAPYPIYNQPLPQQAPPFAQPNPPDLDETPSDLRPSSSLSYENYQKFATKVTATSEKLQQLLLEDQMRTAAAERVTRPEFVPMPIPHKPRVRPLVPRAMPSPVPKSNAPASSIPPPPRRRQLFVSQKDLPYVLMEEGQTEIRSPDRYVIHNGTPSRSPAVPLSGPPTQPFASAPNTFVKINDDDAYSWTDDDTESDLSGSETDPTSDSGGEHLRSNEPASNCGFPLPPSLLFIPSALSRGMASTSSSGGRLGAIKPALRRTLPTHRQASVRWDAGKDEVKYF